MAEGCGVFLSVGSNIEPERNIRAALGLLGRRVRVAGISTFYRTEPLGWPGQPRFLNGVVRVETTIGPRPLKFGVLREIESGLGRVRTGDRNAARTIDLDILVYGDRVIWERGLRVPDPEIRERPFLSVPLLELAPGLVLADTGELLRARVRPGEREGLEREGDFTARLRRSVLS